MARKIAFAHFPVLDEMQIDVNGPVHFDDYVSVISNRIENAAMDFDMVNYNSLLSEMQEFNLKPAIILDAPIEMELPNHGWAHIPAIENGENVEMEEETEFDFIDETMNRIDEEFPIEDEFDCIPD
ncbi:MAG TPA: hypothetical protein PLM27_13295 [Chitinophagales bacterium]|nr:hypothetical protein [Chitinophagales bacterium]